MPPSKKARTSKSSSPSGVPDYASPEYWSSRYNSGDTHEWYFSYASLSPLLSPLLPAESKGAVDVLELGCGPRPLLPAMHADAPGLNLLATDISPACLSALPALPGLTYRALDASKLPFPDSSVPLVLEKGTLDAVISHPTLGPSLAGRILAEMARVSSRYLVVVSHVDLNTEVGEDWMRDVFAPALVEGDKDPLVHFKVRAHLAAAEEDGEDEEDGGGEGSPGVYVVEKLRRKETRALKKRPPEGLERVDVEVLEH